MLTLTAAAGAAQELPIPEIPYEKFVLDNGLTVVIHEDHKSPIVAVNVWYHVGAKNEPEGKTGFAHLFEHLMFNGSEHYDDEYFKPFEEVGATQMNGTTNSDRTNYFQNVPSSALDLALWMESDRMCCMKAAVDQVKLDEQRGVVQNEKRQNENQPYGEVFNLIQENTYPEGHPYDGTVIGSMEDLNAASLADVHEWFDTYYGPNNATLVIAGDVDTKQALERVEHYFGGIAPGPPIARQAAWVAKREGPHRQVLQDRVPQARIYKVWNVPQLTSPAFDRLQLFGEILANGKNSRLYERLVYRDRIATDVGVLAFGRELGSLFIAYATAKPGQDSGELERATDAEVNRLLADGFSAEELARAKTGFFASFIRGVERIGGFNGKSDVLASSEVYYGDPGGYRRGLENVRSATSADVLREAREWLTSGEYTLVVQPYPQLTAVGTPLDRTDGPPLPSDFPAVDFQEYERTELRNGLDLIVAPHSAVPVVQALLLVDAGYAADKGRKLGTAGLALNMMDEGTENLDALEIAARLDRLGASVELSSTLDTSQAALSALTFNLEESIALFADIVLRPTFPEHELERLRGLQLAAIRQELADPFSVALRLFPQLIYDEEHAYAIPFTGSGTLESTQSITRDDLARFHEAWFHPNNSTLIVVGDTNLQTIAPLVEKHFGAWPRGEVPQKNVAPQSAADASVLYVVDRPGAEQSVIVAGHIAPPYRSPDKLELEMANEVLGGSFTARLNMNLREDKHWSYGARSLIAEARGPRPFFVYAPVQTDRTAESMAEIEQELTALVTDEPPSPQEIATVKNRIVLSLPGRWETADAVAQAIAEIEQFGLAASYWDTYPERIRALGMEAVAAAAERHLRPQRLVWVVIGDWARIEKPVRALGLGEVHRVDATGAIAE
jgi:zinc protease